MSPIRTFLLLAIVAVVAGMPAAASAVAGDSCADRFPEVAWVSASDGPITVETTGMREALTDRFVREIDLVSAWIADEIGPTEVTVCLIDSESPLDVERFVPQTQRFHARMDMDERLLLISNERVGFVGPAAAWAIAHHALWQNGGDRPHPEPIASVVGQWYRARALDRLELYHREVMFENFFDTEAVIDWASSEQPRTRNWDPERNFQAIGDFVDYAVATHGTEVLLERDGDRWSEIEEGWRIDLRSDLTGRTTPTTEWIVGVVITVGLLLVAIVAVALGLWSKHRGRQRPPTDDAIPGFFSEG